MSSNVLLTRFVTGLALPVAALAFVPRAALAQEAEGVLKRAASTMGDPKSIRYDERAKAKLLTINGVSLANRKQATAWAKQIVEFRTKVTIDAIEKAVANKGTLPAAPRRAGEN